VIDAALLAVIAENGRSELATRVAIDATGIDKKISRHIFRQALLNTGHQVSCFGSCSDDDAKTTPVQVGSCLVNQARGEVKLILACFTYQ
jgi:hypothetical protein